MTMACGARELQSQKRPHGTAGEDHLRAGEARVLEDPVQGDRGQHRQEEKQAAEFGAERRGAEVQLPDIGDIGDGGSGANGPFIIGPAWQASEAFLLKDVRDGDRTERVALVGQAAADVVDRQVLLTQRDDPLAEGIGFGRGLWSLGWGEEEVAAGILAELMDQDTETPRGIAKSAGGLLTGQPLDEVGAEGFILTMGRVGWFQEDAGEVS